jgi:hypothetical protein
MSTFADPILVHYLADGYRFWIYGKIYRPAVNIRDAPDTGTDLAGYPANLKARYRVSGAVGYRISGRIFNTTFECHQKYSKL